MKKLLLLALVALTGACASARATTPADRPALEVPPPPPRTIEPVPPPESSQPEPVADLPPAPPATRPRPQSREAREPAKQEPKAEVPVEPAPPPAPVTPPQPSPESQVRTPATADSAEAVRQVREILDRTGRALNTVDFKTLTGERQKAYKEAQEFMLGSEEALKRANYVFARSLAEKAEKLVRELQSR